MRELEVGFSTCPNDTFMFHALVHGLVAVDGVRFRPVLADIEELNQRATGADPLPVTKLSVPALAAAAGRYLLLDSGAALGRGCGPLVVGQKPRALGELGAGARVAIPGRLTTARLLFRLFAPDGAELVEMRFDRIMPAVAAGEVDAGVVIHEGRFTYRGLGLRAIADLGALWEEDGLPLPLGLIAVDRELPPDLARRIGDGLRRSIELARREPERSRAWVREHAQELADEVCAEHIALYVNDFSVALGDVGRAAVDALLRRGRERGLLADGPDPWLSRGPSA